MKTAVLIPAFNEEKTIEKVVKLTKKYLPKTKILVVDDGSNDKTSEKAKKSGAEVLRNEKNMGKGYSIIRGMKYLSKYEWVIFLDADMQYLPQDVKSFLLFLNKSEFVIGARNVSKIPSIRHGAANMLMAFIFNSCFGTDLQDITCGIRAIKTDLWKKMHLKYSDYMVEAEMLYEALRLKAKITQVPIEVRYEKKSGIKRGIKIVSSIIIHTIWWRLFGK